MRAKDKAKELVEKFLPYSYYHEMDNSMNRNYQQEDNAKQCALICVDEIIKQLDCISFNHDIEDLPFKYWEEVKQEIYRL